ncbi:MAG: LysM peptidoglycan-binding domain-containing protein [Oscillospiraceae bacterium]
MSLIPTAPFPEAKPAETPAPAEDKPADSGSGEANIIKHTVGEWDTLVKVCGSYGMNFYNVKSAIMKLNGFTSEKQLDSLRPGQIIKLPASEADAKNVTSSDWPRRHIHRRFNVRRQHRFRQRHQLRCQGGGHFHYDLRGARAELLRHKEPAYEAQRLQERKPARFPACRPDCEAPRQRLRAEHSRNSRQAFYAR